MLRIIALLLLALIATPATAYVGPGAGISVLGSLLGILATIFVAIGAILFWPIRKLMRRRKAKKETEVSGDTDTSGIEN
jgi:membrane protein implicated in regulation of membrane protease activity